MDANILEQKGERDQRTSKAAQGEVFKMNTKDYEGLVLAVVLASDGRI